MLIHLACTVSTLLCPSLAIDVILNNCSVLSQSCLPVFILRSLLHCTPPSLQYWCSVIVPMQKGWETFCRPFQENRKWSRNIITSSLPQYQTTKPVLDWSTFKQYLSHLPTTEPWTSTALWSFNLWYLCWDIWRVKTTCRIWLCYQPVCTLWEVSISKCATEATNSCAKAIEHWWWWFLC